MRASKIKIFNMDYTSVIFTRSMRKKAPHDKWSFFNIWQQNEKVFDRQCWQKAAKVVKKMKTMASERLYVNKQLQTKNEFSRQKSSSYWREGCCCWKDCCWKVGNWMSIWALDSVYPFEYIGEWFADWGWLPIGEDVEKGNEWAKKKKLLSLHSPVSVLLEFDPRSFPTVPVSHFCTGHSNR